MWPYYNIKCYVQYAHFNVQMLRTVTVVIQQGKVVYKMKEIHETKQKATYKLIKEEKNVVMATFSENSHSSSENVSPKQEKNM